MSTDEIQFGDVTYREPRRVRRPDRDRAFACQAYEVPGAGDLPIFLDLDPADAIERHALSDTSVELGGILLGYECVDEDTGEPFVWITRALEARHYENTQASFTYTHDSWAEITRERDEKFPDLDIVGWYHTHPSFGIFLSGHDLFIHRHFFAQPLNVAYVVDPIHQTRGFFRWHGGQMDQVGGFFVCAERARRPDVARFLNDLEHLPNPERGGGMVLSPRLEAELIAMLNRPHQQTVVAAPAAAASGVGLVLLGVLVGMLALSGALWLNGLARTIQDQTADLDAMRKTLATRGTEADSARLSAKEEAVDALLREVRVGAGRETFLEAYQKVVSERDRARKATEDLNTERDALLELSGKLRGERKAVDEKLAASERQIVKLQDAADEVRDDYEKQLSELNAQLADQTKLVAQTQAGTLRQRYYTAWYAAVVAGVGCLLLGLGLVWSLFRVPPGDGATGASSGMPVRYE